MIHFLHLGYGGRYKTYISETIKKISRHRSATISGVKSIQRGYKVAVCPEGRPLTQADLRDILSRDMVTFVVGDSNGMPDDIIFGSDAIFSVSSLTTINHQMEAAILAEAVEYQLARSEACVAR